MPSPLQDLFNWLQGSWNNYQTQTPDNFLSNPTWNNSVVNNLNNNQTTSTLTPPQTPSLSNQTSSLQPQTSNTTNLPNPFVTAPTNNQPINPQGIQISALSNLAGDFSEWYDKITKEYAKAYGELGLWKAQLDSRYDNLWIINDKISAVAKQYEQWVNNPLLISRNTGLTQEDVQKVLRWDIYKDLKLSESAFLEANKPYQQGLSDLELQKQRNLEDINTKTERAKISLSQHLDEIANQTYLQTSWLEKSWALTQQGLSSWFQMWIESIKNNANKIMDNLKQNAERDDQDTMKVKNRMLEDYTTNVTKIRDTAENEFNKIKIQWLSALQEIEQRRWVASDRAYEAYKSLYRDIDKQKNQINRDTFDMYNALNDITLKRADAIGKAFWLTAQQDYLKNQWMYEAPDPTQDIVGQRAEDVGFATPWQVTTFGKTFGWMWWVDIAWKLNDPVLAQKWWTVLAVWQDQARTINWVKYPPNKFIEILSDDWKTVIRYNHLNFAWDWYQTFNIGKKINAWDQIWGMWYTWVTSRDIERWGNKTWIHVDMTAYEAVNGKRWKMYQTTEEQRNALLGWKIEQPQSSDVTDAELAFYLKWATGIWKGKLTQERYNEVANYVKEVAKTDPSSVIKLLPQTQQDRIYKVMDDFEWWPNKLFQQVQQGKNYVDNFDVQNATATDDQWLMYAVAKLMDPDSVVRDSEYATTSKFAQSALQKFWIDTARVFVNWQALTEQARKQLINWVNNLYKAQEQTYNNQIKNYANRIKTFTSIDWTPFIPDLRWESTPTQQNNKPLTARQILESLISQ